jgi:hypothetical protein
VWVWQLAARKIRRIYPDSRADPGARVLAEGRPARNRRRGHGRRPLECPDGWQARQFRRPHGLDQQHRVQCRWPRDRDGYRRRHRLRGQGSATCGLSSARAAFTGPSTQSSTREHRGSSWQARAGSRGSTPATSTEVRTRFAASHCTMCRSGASGALSRTSRSRWVRLRGRSRL